MGNGITVKLPDSRLVYVAEVARCIAEALHPAPVENYWRFLMQEKRREDSPGSWRYEPLQQADWDKLNALWDGANLPRLDYSLTDNGQFSRECFEPFKRALKSDNWQENWEPVPEFQSDKADAEKAQWQAKSEHGNVLSAEVRKGNINTFTANFAPCSMLATNRLVRFCSK